MTYENYKKLLEKPVVILRHERAMRKTLFKSLNNEVNQWLELFSSEEITDYKAKIKREVVHYDLVIEQKL